jgi:hypothetical protein
MSRSSVAWVLRTDGAFNFLAGLVLLLFYRPVVTKGLAGVIILYWVFIARIELPSAWLLPAAVGIQVLFALGEAVYLYSYLRHTRST